MYSAEGGGGNGPSLSVRFTALRAEASNCELPELWLISAWSTLPCMSTLTRTTQLRLTLPAEAKPQLGRTASMTCSAYALNKRFSSGPSLPLLSCCRA